MYIRRKVFSIAHDENGEEKLFSTTDYQSQKEFASVRGMKKQTKALVDAFSNQDIKKVGKVSARINKQGLNKNSEKFALEAGSEKVRKGSINKIEKMTGQAWDKKSKEMISEGMKNQQINLGKQNIARGGKGIKFKS
jgi:hypothetical protein